MNVRTNKNQTAKSQSVAGNVAQRKPNKTGLPDNLKSGIETLSGHSMDDVKVHYNSSRPAQLQAHAFAQGNQIHLAPGQEKHLPHEAWHVVQQKQGRVQPTMQLKSSVPVNDDPGLEREADEMGAQALKSIGGAVQRKVKTSNLNVIQRVEMASTVTGITHLVQAVNDSIFKGIKGQEVNHGQKVVVDISKKIRSRRGPNQEVFEAYDEQNQPEYRWVLVVSIDGRSVPNDSYIRDDTFVHGASILRGSPFKPSIDHRERKKPDQRDREFDNIDAPTWYERPLGRKKSSTADKKHAKLLEATFGTSAERIGPAMVHHSQDPDMPVVLSTIGLHMTHIAPWLVSDVESGGKDRHEGYQREGEYSRTSVSHPMRQEYESHQKALGFYQKGITDEPINEEWGKLVLSVMRVDKFRDRMVQTPRVHYRQSEDATRIARGTGALIGHEEMARETAQMRLELLKTMQRLDPGQITNEMRVIDHKIAFWEKRVEELSDLRKGLEDEIPNLKLSSVAIGKQMGGRSETEQIPLKQEMERISFKIKELQERVTLLKKEIQDIPIQLKSFREEKELLKTQLEHLKKYSGSVVSGLAPGPLKPSRTTNRSMLDAYVSPAYQHRPGNFATRLHLNRRRVKLGLFFTQPSPHGISDASGREHPNLILERQEWKGARPGEGEQKAVQELSSKWTETGLHTNLQVRGSFGHHRPSISPLADGRVRINPGLYPTSLLQKGIGHIIGSTQKSEVDPRMDFIHREALQVAVSHALEVIQMAKSRSRSEKMSRIKEFAIDRLMINILKANVVLKARIPDPKIDHEFYLRWLEKDYVKTTQTLENLNESSHLLISAIVNEHHSTTKEPFQLRPGPFEGFVRNEFTGRVTAIYYVASGMQALTTGSIAAVAYRRMMAQKTDPRKAKYHALHPYFEMKDKVAADAGFDNDSKVAKESSEKEETIIADLSPVDTKANVNDQSHQAVRDEMKRIHDSDRTLIPVLDATAIPLEEVKGMVPKNCKNFIIAESLTKYAQLGSDKALGGRIIVVGDHDFVEKTKVLIAPVEQSANMIVSRVWFESMENMRYSH